MKLSLTATQFLIFASLAAPSLAQPFPYHWDFDDNVAQPQYYYGGTTMEGSMMKSLTVGESSSSPYPPTSPTSATGESFFSGSAASKYLSNNKGGNDDMTKMPFHNVAYPTGTFSPDHASISRQAPPAAAETATSLSASYMVPNTQQHQGSSHITSTTNKEFYQHDPVKYPVGEFSPKMMGASDFTTQGEISANDMGSFSLTEGELSAHDSIVTAGSVGSNGLSGSEFTAKNVAKPTKEGLGYEMVKPNKVEAVSAAGSNENMKEVKCTDAGSSCGTCLQAGCEWDGRFCVSDCSIIADAACYSPKTFLDLHLHEICEVAETELADNLLCDTMTECGACTSTFKSDGTSKCQWYVDERGDEWCGTGECDFLGRCGSDTCETKKADTKKETGSSSHHLADFVKQHLFH